MVTIAIYSDKIYYPVLIGSVSYQTVRKGSPGTLKFTVLKDSELTLENGNLVTLSEDGSGIFYGFLFSIKPQKDGQVECTCYDQLRYFKNKDVRSYVAKKTSELLKDIAGDYGLATGMVDDTGYKVTRDEDDVSLFDMLQNSMDDTLLATGNLFVLYDDFGKLCLRNADALLLDVMIDADVAADYSYTVTIDSEVYNKIKLIYDNEDTGKREIYIAQDSGNISRWGVLQYVETLDSADVAKEKAAKLLDFYNEERRTLTVSDCIGDSRVRAGSSIFLSLKLADVTIYRYMLVETASHTWEGAEHRMDLELRGGEING